MPYFTCQAQHLTALLSIKAQTLITCRYLQTGHFICP